MSQAPLFVCSMWNIIGKYNTGLLLVNTLNTPFSLVIIPQPPGIPHQLLRDLVRGADAADPDDVPGDALQAVALLIMRHLKVGILT